MEWILIDEHAERIQPQEFRAPILLPLSDPPPQHRHPHPGRGTGGGGSAEPCSKVTQWPRPWGGDPGAALLGRGWMGRGRGSSPARAAGRDRPKGLRAEAVVQPGAPRSCGPGILDPSPRQGKGPRSPLPTLSSWSGVRQAPAWGVLRRRQGRGVPRTRIPGLNALPPGARKVG